MVNALSNIWIGVASNFVSPLIYNLGTTFLTGGVAMVETPDFSFGIDFGGNAGTVTSQAADLASAGAQIILIPAALPETARAASYRRTMLASESLRTVSVCVFSGAGPHESTGEQLCAGHALIASEGKIIAENNRFERNGSLT